MQFTEKETQFWLDTINKIKPLESILSLSTDLVSLNHYYKVSGSLYRRYHSKEGAMHLPIELNSSERHKEKLLFQARCVSGLIEKEGTKNVVELGCGSGFNSIYLAKLHPDTNFLGLDVNEQNLDVAQQMSRGLNNIKFQHFDFTKQHQYSTDIVFAFETLCYSGNIAEVFRNINNCLTPGGHLLVFDGYESEKSKRPNLTVAEEIASRIFCKGFMLDKFQDMDEVLRALQGPEWNITIHKDFTDAVLPNFRRFQASSIKVLKYPWLVKQLMHWRISSLPLLLQSLAGLFGPHFMEKDYYTYRYLMVRKL